MRGGDRDAGMALPDAGGCHALMRRVGVGMEEADRDRLDAVADEVVCLAVKVVEIERHQLAAVARQPFGDLAPEIAGYDRLRRAVERVVDLRPVAAAERQHVAEALGGDQPDAGPAFLYDGIYPGGRSVEDAVEVRGLDGQPGEPGKQLFD